jgi:hypothetical protein
VLSKPPDRLQMGQSWERVTQIQQLNAYRYASSSSWCGVTRKTNAPPDTPPDRHLTVPYTRLDSVLVVTHLSLTQRVWIAVHGSVPARCGYSQPAPAPPSTSYSSLLLPLLARGPCRTPPWPPPSTPSPATCCPPDHDV